jgi:hypothetical protein
VAPAARPDFVGVKGPDDHYVDGGYHDNFGIDSLIDWLRESLNPNDAPPQIARLPDILVLTIRHLNAGTEPLGSVPALYT